MATRQWIVSTSGTYDFNAAGNWQFGIVPGAFDIAQFYTSGLATDTITGNATIAELLVSTAFYNLAGTYTISGAQPTELSVGNGGLPASVTILPGAAVTGNQAVVVNGNLSILTIEGTLVASSLSVTAGAVYILQGATLAVGGPISLSSGELVVRPQFGGPAGPAIAIDNAIQLTGSDVLFTDSAQEADFNGVISGAGMLVFGADEATGDTIALNGNNTFSGGTLISRPALTVEAGNADAFGTGTITIGGGELLATTTETIANSLLLNSNVIDTLAAAHAQTLTIGTGHWTLDPTFGPEIAFGAAGQDGTVILKDTSGHTINAGSYGVVVQAGTLRSGADVGVAALVNNATNVTVQAGATLDSGGFGLTISNLTGGGRITNSGGLAALTFPFMTGAYFTGVIDGAFAVTVSGSLTLSNDNSYTGGTLITGTGQLVLGYGNATGSVIGPITDNHLLYIARSDAFTVSNVSGTGQLIQDGPGTLTLGSGLSYSGGTGVEGGTLAVGNPATLGSGNLTINGLVTLQNPSGNAELLATATETISSPGTITLETNSTIAAAHGQTLTINPNTLTFNANAITFGAAGQDGVVALKKGSTVQASNPGAYVVTVQAGALTAADTGFDLQTLLDNDWYTVVQTGATLDVNGVTVTAPWLQGGGNVTNSGGAALLAISNVLGLGFVSGPGNGGTFSGIISGALSLETVAGTEILTGNNTYTGTTTIDSGSSLELGAGGTSGAVSGSIVDNGSLILNHSDTFTLNNVSGSGKVFQYGSGTAILGSGLSYTGGTTLSAGTLAVGNPSALGSGALTIYAGKLLATVSETISSPGTATLAAGSTLAAAHGQTLTFNPGDLHFGNGTLYFGAAGQDGTIALKKGSTVAADNPGNYTVNVQAGTLTGTDAGFDLQTLLNNDAATIVQTGATLDVNGITVTTPGLQGGGHIVNSGANALLAITNGGNFSGTIGGPLALEILSGAAMLSGTNTYTGVTTIFGGTELTLGNGGATGSVASTAIVDNGILEFNLFSSSIESGVISGTGLVVQDGPGTTVLTQTNTYSGGTFIGGGTLELQRSSSAGSGGITFLNSGADTLRIDGTTMPSNALFGFASGDTIDLANVAYANNASVILAGGNLLQLHENGSTYTLHLDPAQNFSGASWFAASNGAGGTAIGELLPIVTATNQSVAYNQSVPLSNIFTVAGGGITQYQLWFSWPEGGDPADGQVTDHGVPIAADRWVTLTSLSGLNYIGAGTAGSDHLWLKAYNGQWGSWAQAVLTDPGVTPDTITATNQSVAYNQSVGLASIFSVTGAAPSQYQVWFSVGGVGSVTDGTGAIAMGQAVNETSLSAVNYIGSSTSGSDALWLRTFDGQWSSWVKATLTDPGVAPDNITATNQRVVYNQSVGLASIFGVTGAAPTRYQVWFSVGGVGSVTDSHGAIATGTAVDETSLSGVNYIGGGAPGSDALWLRAFDGQWSDWVKATLTDPGATPDSIIATDQSIAYNQSAALSSLFAVTGPTPSQYQVWFSAGGVGTVTDGNGAIAMGQAVNETSLSGVNYVGGGMQGTDRLWLRAFDGQWSPWVVDTLTNPGVPADTITAHTLSVAHNQSVGLASLFAVTGPTPSLYQVWLSLPTDGAVTDGGIAPIATGQAVNETTLNGVNFIGGAAAGSDALWLRSFDGQWSDWVKTTMTNLG